jgi:biotin carboxyl carrier protein
MSEALASDLAQLVDLFRRSGWSELRVEGEAVSLLLSNDPDTPGLGEQSLPSPPDTELAAAIHGAKPVPAPAALAPVLRASAAPTEAADANWLPVAAPNLGTFYRSPKPGAAPFVELGDRVTAETEICLLEVMKLFTSVKAGVAGTVRRVCAAEAELVEGGRVLFLIEPA